MAAEAPASAGLAELDTGWFKSRFKQPYNDGGLQAMRDRFSRELRANLALHEIPDEEIDRVCPPLIRLINEGANYQSFAELRQVADGNPYFHILKYNIACKKSLFGSSYELVYFVSIQRLQATQAGVQEAHPEA